MNFNRQYFIKLDKIQKDIQARIHDFTLGGALLGEWSGDRVQGSARWGTGGKAPSKLLRIRKYRTSFLNWNWLKLYHVRHDHDAYNEVWYYTHDVTVRHCYNLNMKNSNQRLLLVPGNYVWFCSMHITLYPFAQKRKN